MATTTELGLLSLTHLHKLTQQQHQHHNNNNNKNQNQDQDHHHRQDQEYLLNPNNPSGSNTPISSGSTSWMWNPKGQQGQEAPAEEESWEVRAFAEDTGSVMGTTWPPRSYTCAFCRREFRSAQALGGHMNVHRRDRARLHQVIPHNSPLLFHPPPGPSSSSSSSAGSAQLCLLYQHPPPGPTGPAGPSTLLSMSMLPPPPYGGGGDGGDRRVVGRQDPHRQIRAEERTVEIADPGGEEVDLELRLGHGPTPS